METLRKGVPVETTANPEGLSIRIGLTQFVREMYPRTEKTKIPEVICHLVEAVEPCCKRNPIREKGEEAEKSWLAIRGSSVKRQLLYEPTDYWQISPIYQRMSCYWIGNKEDPLTAKVLEKISIGPHDLDLMYVLAEGKTTQDLLTAIYDSFKNQHFVEIGHGNKQNEPHNSNGLSEKIVFGNGRNQAEIIHYQKASTTDYPKHFIKINLFEKGRSILKIDLATVDYGEGVDNDFRFTGYMPLFDILAAGYITKKGKKCHLTIPIDLMYYFDKWQGVRLCYLYILPNTFFGRLRTVGNLTFWSEPLTRQPYNLPELLERFNQVELTEPVDWRDLFQAAQQQKLKERLPDIISEFLVYLTYDPFLFLKLAFECRLFEPIPLGRYIQNYHDLMAITEFMAEELSQSLKNYYLQDPTNTLPKLSDYYKRNCLTPYQNIDFIGPVMLIRALNRLLEERGQKEIPQTLESAISLFNPISLIKDQDKTI